MLTAVWNLASRRADRAGCVVRFWLFDDGLASSAPVFWRVARVRELNIEAPCASTRARTALGGSLIGLVWQIFFRVAPGGSGAFGYFIPWRWGVMFSF